MTAAERSFAGPDAWGRTFKAEPCRHVAAWEDIQRLARKRQAAASHYRRSKVR